MGNDGTPETVLEVVVLEKTTALFTAVVTDADGTTPVPAAQVSTLTLDLYEAESGTAINSRTGSSILNTGGGTLDSSGNLTLELAPADNALVDPSADRETHVALVKWTLASGRQGGHRLLFTVQNELKTT